MGYRSSSFSNISVATTTTSAVFVTLLTVTVTTTGDAQLLCFAGASGDASDNLTGIDYAIFIDGVQQVIQTGRDATDSTGGINGTVTLEWLKTGITPGSHTVTLQWRIAGGITARIDPTTRIQGGTLLVVVLNTPVFEETGAVPTPQPPDPPPYNPFVKVDEPFFGSVKTDDTPLWRIGAPLPDPIPPPPNFQEEAFSGTLVTDDTFVAAQPPPVPPPCPVFVDEPFMGVVLSEDGVVIPQLPPEPPLVPPPIDESFMCAIVSEDGVVIPQLPPEPPLVPPPVDEPFMGVVLSEDGYAQPQLPPEPPIGPFFAFVDEPFMGVLVTDDTFFVAALPPEPPPFAFPFGGEDEPFPGSLPFEDGFFQPQLPPESPFFQILVVEFVGTEEPPPPPSVFFTPGSGTGGYGPRLEIVDVYKASQFFFAFLAQIAIDEATAQEEERLRRARILGVVAAVKRISYSYQVAGTSPSPPASPTPRDLGALAAGAAMALVAAAREREEKRSAGSPRYPMTTSGRVPRRAEVRVSRNKRAFVAHDLGWLQLERGTAKRMHAAGVPVRVLGFRNTLDDLHAAPLLEGEDFDLAVRGAKMSPVVVQRAAPENFAARDREAVAFFAREEDVAQARAAELREMTPMVATLIAAPGGSEEAPGPAMILCASTVDGDLVLPSGPTRVGEEVRSAAARTCKDCGVEVVAEEMRLAWVGEGPGQVTWYVFAATQWMQVSSPSHVTWAPPRALMSQASPRVKTVYERALRAVAVGQLV